MRQYKLKECVSSTWLSRRPLPLPALYHSRKTQEVKDLKVLKSPLRLNNVTSREEFYINTNYRKISEKLQNLCKIKNQVTATESIRDHAWEG